MDKLEKKLINGEINDQQYELEKEKIEEMMKNWGKDQNLSENDENDENSDENGENDGKFDKNA